MQFGLLCKNNSRLYLLLHLLKDFVSLEFKKDLTLTEIYRTIEENSRIYSYLPENERPKSSVHCQWEGADIRSTDFTQIEIDKILKFLNCFKFRNEKSVGIYHQLRNGAPHFHIQFAKDGTK